MNVFEHTTKLWLESNGFFVFGPLRIGHNEVDLLALKPDSECRNIVRRVHVEVTVSGRPTGSGGELKEYVEKKFATVHTAVSKLLGAEYERWIIIGNRDDRDRSLIDDGPNHSVLVIPFVQVVSEYICSLQNTPADDLGRLLDCLSELGLLKR